jgi:hypothetical protein
VSRFCYWYKYNKITNKKQIKLLTKPKIILSYFILIDKNISSVEGARARTNQPPALSEDEATVGAAREATKRTKPNKASLPGRIGAAPKQFAPAP